MNSRGDRNVDVIPGLAYFARATEILGPLKGDVARSLRCLSSRLVPLGAVAGSGSSTRPLLQCGIDGNSGLFKMEKCAIALVVIVSVRFPCRFLIDHFRLKGRRRDRGDREET